MGWYVSLALIIAYIVKGDAALICAAGLFAIAGSIDIMSTKLK